MHAPTQVASLASAGRITPSVAEAALSLLDACRASPGIEPAVVVTMQHVAMLIGETLARAAAPPTTRLVESLAPLDVSSAEGRAQAQALMAAAFAPGGSCTREEFVADVSFFLESLDDTEQGFAASVAETVQKGTDAAFAEVKAAADGRADARRRMAALLELARDAAA